MTDPDSRNVKTPRGYMQGYNAQAATNEAQIVIAAEVTIASSDSGHLEPMVSATQTELRAAGVTDAPEVVVADAKGWRPTSVDPSSDATLGSRLAGGGRRSDERIRTADRSQAFVSSRGA